MFKLLINCLINSCIEPMDEDIITKNEDYPLNINIIKKKKTVYFNEDYNEYYLFKDD